MQIKGAETAQHSDIFFSATIVAVFNGQTGRNQSEKKEDTNTIPISLLTGGSVEQNIIHMQYLAMNPVF